jgi:hypothetical protein
MKLLVSLALAICFLSQHALGQGAQADQIKRRAKELSNQNNVRQGVPPPSQPPARQPTIPPARPAVAGPVAATRATLQQQSVSRLSADIAAIKAGATVAFEQKQQLIKDVATTVRGATKPSLAAVTKFVNGLAGALAGKNLGVAKQSRLAQNVEAVLNSERLPAAQFDAIIDDVQAIFQEGGAKRDVAIAIANDLKAVGAEVRKLPAK